MAEGRVVGNSKSLQFYTVNPYTQQQDRKVHNLKQMPDIEIRVVDQGEKTMTLIRSVIEGMKI